jgi:hypothetical protein
LHQIANLQPCGFAHHAIVVRQKSASAKWGSRFEISGAWHLLKVDLDPKTWEQFGNNSCRESGKMRHDRAGNTKTEQ